ncbi:MAG: TetR/AcrR family transcriptional regulator [Flavipsychrobacter sp.]
MSTKTKIIKSSVELFNNKGFNETTIRDIAAATGISSGNFAYHFKNKEAVIEYFYNHMYDEVHIDDKIKETDDFKTLNDVFKYITSFMEKYRFFYINLIDIFNTCPLIKDNYYQNYQDRIGFYRKYLVHYIALGLLDSSQEKYILTKIPHSIWFQLTFWQAQKKVLPHDFETVKSKYIIDNIWGLITPFMTTKGKENFEKVK